MLYWLLVQLHAVWGPLNVFRYITFRAALAILTALVLGIALGPALIRALRRNQIGQTIREEGPASHKAKAGTPTMGGILILAAVLVPILLWGDLTEPWVWVVILTTLLYGGIGFLDDLLKVRSGQEPRPPRVAEVRPAASRSARQPRPPFASSPETRPYAGDLVVPFFKNAHVQLGCPLHARSWPCCWPASRTR